MQGNKWIFRCLRFYCYSLIDFITTAFFPPSVPPRSLFHLPSPPVSLFLCFPSEKRQLRNINQNNITSYSKTRHKISYQVWTRQSSRRKRVSRTGKRVRDIPTSTVRSPTTPSYTAKMYIQRTYPCSRDPGRLCNCHFSLCEAPWALLGQICGQCSSGT